jgi:MinD-like ATPase involved in chromosome partitioning or flagellar assembly
VARHDREDPHSLEDQLAWLDAIKEMPDEVEIAVSAVTSASLAAATAAPSTEDEAPSPYPKDPWQSVPPEPTSGALFRTAVDSVYGSATVSVVEENAGDKADRSAEERAGEEGLAPERDDFSGRPPASLGGVDTISIPPESLGRLSPPPASRESFASPLTGDSYSSPLSDQGSRDSYPSSLSEQGSRDSYSSLSDQGSYSTQPVGQPGFPAPPAGQGSADLILGAPDTYSTPLFGEVLSRGAFSESPADTDSYNVGAFAEIEARPPQPEVESGSAPALADEPMRGWLEPAIPVESEEPATPFPAAPATPPAPQLDHAHALSDRSENTGPQPDFAALPTEWTPLQSERLPAQPERPALEPERTVPQPQRTPLQPERASFGDDRFTGSIREDIAAEERKPYERETGAVQEREREPYQARRRSTGQPAALNAPARTSGSKPSADSLDPVNLLRGRRNAPSRGWRRFVYKATAGLIKPGEPSEVKRRRELLGRARTPVAAGHHRVAVLSLKGGVGKTTTTVGLGATLAQVRGDRVIAVDANPDRGTLSDKVELETSATVRDLLNERGQIKRYVDIRAFTSQAPSRLEILASDRDPSVSEAFSAADYQSVSQVLENFYSICITDCGTGLLHSAMSGVLGLADQLVLVSSPSVDGARAASATLDWLEAHNYADLVKSATVVLCSVRPRSKSTVDLNRLEAHFAARCRAVVRVPYDPHLEEGAEIDLDRLAEPTREAYLRLAACVGDGFAGPQALGERRFSEIPDPI